MKSAEKERYYFGILFVSFSLGTRKRKGVPGDGWVVGQGLLRQRIPANLCIHLKAGSPMRM